MDSKFNDIIRYYMGVKSYYLFLLGLIYNNPIYSDYILDKDNIKISKVSFISNIFMAIKESLVEMQEDGYVSKIDIDILDSSSRYISTKRDKGYEIDNYVFSSVFEMYNVIRNKLGHGNYVIDLERNMVIIRHDNTDIGIDIDKLSLFVISSCKGYISDKKFLDRTIVVNKKIITNRTKKISTKSELRGVLRNFKIWSVSLRRYDNQRCDKKIIDEFDDAMKVYKESLDVGALYSFSKSLSCEYEFNYKEYTLSTQDIEGLTCYLYNNTDFDIDYKMQMALIGNQVANYVKSNSFCNDNEMMIFSNLKNLILLNGIDNTNSVDIDKIVGYMNENDMNVGYLDTYELVTTCISMFNMLFSYGIGSVYHSKLTDRNGFDYGKLDLSGIRVTNINVDEKLGLCIENSLTNLKGIQRKISVADEKINKLYDNLCNVTGNLSACKKIWENINHVLCDKRNLINEYNKSMNALRDYKVSVRDNYKHLYNERIISGIRNSIAHGNYRVRLTDDIESSVIIFEDIYGEEDKKVTFSCEVSICDFVNIIHDCSLVINSLSSCYDSVNDMDGYKKNRNC